MGEKDVREQLACDLVASTAFQLKQRILAMEPEMSDRLTLTLTLYLLDMLLASVDATDQPISQ